MKGKVVAKNLKQSQSHLVFFRTPLGPKRWYCPERHPDTPASAHYRERIPLIPGLFSFATSFSSSDNYYYWSTISMTSKDTSPLLFFLYIHFLTFQRVFFFSIYKLRFFWKRCGKLFFLGFISDWMYGLYIHHYIHSSVAGRKREEERKRFTWQMALLTAYGLVLESSERYIVCSETDRPIYQYISLAIQKNTIRYHPLLLTVIDQYATSFPSFPCLFPYAGPIVVALSRSIRASLSPLLAPHKRYSAPIWQLLRS